MYCTPVDSDRENVTNDTSTRYLVSTPAHRSDKSRKCSGRRLKNIRQHCNLCAAPKLTPGIRYYSSLFNFTAEFPMSRWQQKECRDPVVMLIEYIPSCKSCGGVFSLDESVALPATGAGSCLDLPADETYGQMNLRWPLSVRYTKAACGGTSQGCVQEEPETLRNSPSNAPCAMRAEVYGETLSKAVSGLRVFLRVKNRLIPFILTWRPTATATAPITRQHLMYGAARVATALLGAQYSVNIGMCSYRPRTAMNYSVSLDLQEEYDGYGLMASALIKKTFLNEQRKSP